MERAAHLAARFHECGSLVVLVRVTSSGDGKDMLQPTADAPAPAGARPANFADLAPGLNQQPSDLVITKRQWGAFYGTELDLQLRRRGIKTIVLGGTISSLLMRRLAERLEPLHLPIDPTEERSVPRVMIGATGRDTAILGAAALPIFSETNPRFDVLQKPVG